MKIQFQRLTNDSHLLTVVRADGSRIERKLETRSTLLHDLVHYAIEAEADLTDGFWGLLAAGEDFDRLTLEAKQPTRPNLLLVESLVGPMQTFWKQDVDSALYVERAKDKAPFVDLEYVERVRERIRKLWGHWQSTAFHETMELTWPLEK